jgi:hypothetical protein
MSMRNDEHITLCVIGVLKAGTLVFLSDLGDQSIKTPDDIFGGPTMRLLA